MSASEWIQLVGVLLVILGGVGGLIWKLAQGSLKDQIAAANQCAAAALKRVDVLEDWKEEIRVALARDYVRRGDMHAEIRREVLPIRRQLNATHDIVVQIAQRLEIPAVRPGEADHHRHDHHGEDDR